MMQTKIHYLVSMFEEVLRAKKYLSPLTNALWADIVWVRHHGWASRLSFHVIEQFVSGTSKSVYRNWIGFMEPKRDGSLKLSTSCIELGHRKFIQWILEVQR